MRVRGCMWVWVWVCDGIPSLYCYVPCPPLLTSNTVLVGFINNTLLVITIQSLLGLVCWGKCGEGASEVLDQLSTSSQHKLAAQAQPPYTS